MRTRFKDTRIGKCRKNNRLWGIEMVQDTLKQVRAYPIEVSTVIVGLRFGNGNGGYDYLKMAWMIYTTHQGFREALSPLSEIPANIEEHEFVVCCGRLAKESASYTPGCCKLFWESTNQVTLCPFTCLKRDRFCSQTGAPERAPRSCCKLFTRSYHCQR